MKKILIAVVAALSISSCSRANRNTEPAACAEPTQEYAEEMKAFSSSDAIPTPPSPDTDTHKLIAKGNVEIKVKPENVDSIYININALIKKNTMDIRVLKNRMNFVILSLLLFRRPLLKISLMP